MSLPNKIMAWIFGDEQYRVRVTRPDGTVVPLTVGPNVNVPWQGTKKAAEMLVTEHVQVHGPRGYQYTVERVI